MKLFSWVNNKLNGRQSSNNTNIYASNKNQRAQFGAEKEEFSDWPQGFLSIGTLFIKPLKEDNIKDEQNEKSQNPILDFTLEEVKELQKELNALMSSNTQSSTSIKEEEEEESTSIKEEKEEEEEWDDDDDQYLSTIVPNNKANKDKIYYGKKAMVNKKSLSFLLKKMFICGSMDGLRPTYSLRDPTISELPKTRLSKMLRALLRKKIHPHNSSCPTMKRGKKYLGTGHIGSITNYEDDEDDFDTQGNNTIKWDKTDTEYIVLEI